MTAAQLVDAYLARIEAYDRKEPRIHSIIAIVYTVGSPRGRARAQLPRSLGAQ